MTACDDCWDEAFVRAQIGGGHQAEHYEALLLLPPDERPWCAFARTIGKCGELLGHYDAQCGRPVGHTGGHVGPFAIERDADA